MEDILTPLETTAFLSTSDKVEDWHKMEEATGHSRFPVVNRAMRLTGMVTSKDILEKSQYFDWTSNDEKPVNCWTEDECCLSGAHDDLGEYRSNSSR